MKLYELTEQFNCLFDRFDEFSEIEPDTDDDGRYIDENGEIITDLEQYRERFRSAWFDTLSALEGEFNMKAENLAIYIKNYTAEIEAMKKEEKALKERRSTYERNVAHMRQYLMDQMKEIGLSKIDMPRARIGIRRNAESLVIENEIDFIRWAQDEHDDLLKYEMPTIRKTDTKKLLQQGEELPFVHLTRTESLTIK